MQKTVFNLAEQQVRSACYTTTLGHYLSVLQMWEHGEKFQMENYSHHATRETVTLEF